MYVQGHGVPTRDIFGGEGNKNVPFAASCKFSGHTVRGKAEGAEQPSLQRPHGASGRGQPGPGVHMPERTGKA